MAMKEGLSRYYGEADNLPEFEMVYWVDVLNKNPLDATITDKDNPLFLREGYIPGNGMIKREEHKVRKKILDFISEELDKVFLNADLSINYSFISDVIIRKYFKELDAYYREEYTDKDKNKSRVKEILRSRLREILEKHQKDEILLIGHSMGSIIAYDVLTYLPVTIKIDTFITIGSPLGLPIIRGKIASELKQFTPDLLKLEVPSSIKRRWYNLTDVEDKIALNYKLADDFSPNQQGVGVLDLEVNNDYSIDGHRNPHKDYGYLRTPEFSKIIHEFILRKKTPIYKKIVALIVRMIRGN